jgi:hypothetical protein
MLKLAIIATCLAISSAAFASDHPHASMKKLASYAVCPPSVPKVCAVGPFYACCEPNQACMNVLDRPNCLVFGP